MKRLRRCIDDYQIVTKLDREEELNRLVKTWSRMGYRPHGTLQQSVATVRPYSGGTPSDSIVYTQVMVLYRWRWI